MALGNITILDQSTMAGIGARPQQVQANSTTIYAGEPVAKALGAQYVTAMATNKPVVGTDYLAGVAATTSTQTATADGVVSVYPIVPGVQYLIAPNAPASWDTQAEYDALVGDRVLLNLTTGVYTILATDSATNGCVVENLDVFKYPGKVAFSFRSATSYFA